MLQLRAEEREFKASACGHRPRPRIVNSALGTFNPLEVRRHTTILRFISTTEAYIDALNNIMIREQVVTLTSQLRAILQAIDVEASRSWEHRRKAFSRFHGINLSAQNSWKEVEAATHARNSIAHGLGRLTASQIQNDQLPRTLQRIKIYISGGHLIITNESIRVVLDACLRFIRSVDQTT